MEIDASTCIGSSNCMEEAPEAYAVNERGIAVLLTPELAAEVLLRGARACPVDAIRVFERATGRQVHP